MIRLRACCTTQAPSGRAVTPTRLHATPRQLDEKEHVKPAQPKRLDREEVTQRRNPDRRLTTSRGCAGATGSAVCFTSTNSPRSGPSRFRPRSLCVGARVPKALRAVAERGSVDLERKRIRQSQPSRPAPANVKANRVSGTHTRATTRPVRAGGRAVRDRLGGARGDRQDRVRSW